jgi:5-methylcytosine-specific restriction endonuclease McrBC GTP-binding regulatory subunit McrB
MKETIPQRYELWDQFLTRFPLEKLESMSLDEYSHAGSKDSFTWWIESGLDKLGSIWGGSSFKFGIYARANTEKIFNSKQHLGNDQYAWMAKYGETPSEAFAKVRSLISTIAKASRQGDIETIDKIDLGATYKWKIAFHYQNKNTPTSLCIFKKEVLASFLQAKEVNVSPKANFSVLYSEQMKLRDGQDLLEYGDQVWKEGSLLQGYSTLKKDFIKQFPGFSSFTNQDTKYHQQERDFKKELCSIFAEEITPRLHPLPQDEEQLCQLGRDIADLFGRSLASCRGKPQNLVSWRYYSLTKNLDDIGLKSFANAVSRLTDSATSLDERIPEFIDFLHRHSVDGKSTPAATRSMVTFFLFLSNPEKHFFIKTNEINKLLQLFYLVQFNNNSLAPEEYIRVQQLAKDIYLLLVEDNLQPQDMIDVQSFIWSAFTDPKIQDEDQPNTDETNEDDPQPKNSLTPYPLNQILYGPPGTGKTYITAERAIRICDGTIPAPRDALMKRYRELIAEKRISFVSFHQSFSYEEFIEGIKPVLTDQADSEQEKLIYKIEDGLFKRICSMARTAVDDLHRPKSVGIDLSGKNFYKMSVGGKYDPDVESFCFENGYLALGWGGDADFSTLPKDKNWESARVAIKELMVDQSSGDVDKRFAVQAMYWFKNFINIGDIVIVPRGLSQVQAIGQVTGEYEYRPEFLPGEGYVHFRKVEWLIRETAIPVEKVMAKQFSQMSIYSLQRKLLNMEYLEKLLGVNEGKEQPTEAERYVLIIDEINRANISKVLGELITLIEPDKRLGQTNQVTVKLPYSNEEFGIPANLHIVGTMNTADRSLALMDTALRRRFEFEEMMPDPTLLAGIEIEGILIEKLLQTMNLRIEALYDREHTIGHAFFMPLQQDATIENLGSIFSHKIIPLLAEYFFEDWQKIRLVLGDNQKPDNLGAQFILEQELDNNGSVLFGNSTELAMYGLDRVHQYIRNETALTDPDAYIGIYDSAALTED